MMATGNSATLAAAQARNTITKSQIPMSSSKFKMKSTR